MHIDAKVKTKNNFDLIRLFAALQVAILHMDRHLNLNLSFANVLAYFPGVPIFFFISGYLIYQSYENTKNGNLRIFFTNRFLRLYPALYVCFFATIASIYLTGYLDNQNFTLMQFTGWVVAQLTFFQFYTADFLRYYGVGAPNGSLGTISIELQFYALVPFIYFFFRKMKNWLFVIFAILITINLLNTHVNDWSNLAYKLFGVSFVPWLYMFAIGAYLAENKSLQKKILTVNPLLYFASYLIIYYISIKYDFGTGGQINFVSFILLSCMIFSLAHSKPDLARRYLRGNDVSYGIYIYHMPIVNFMIYYNIKESLTSFGLALILSITAAIVSWYVVEKPALKLKEMALRSY